MSTSSSIDDTITSSQRDDEIFASYLSLQGSDWWRDFSGIENFQHNDVSDLFDDGVQMNNDFSAVTTLQTWGHTNCLPPYGSQLGVAPDEDLPETPSTNPLPPNDTDLPYQDRSPTPGTHHAIDEPAEMIQPVEATSISGVQAATTRWVYERDRRLKQLLTGTRIPRDLSLPCFVDWRRPPPFQGIIWGLKHGETNIMDEHGKCTYCAKDVEHGVLHFARHIIDDLRVEHTPVGKGRTVILSTPERVNEAFDWFLARSDLHCARCGDEFSYPYAAKRHAMSSHGIELNFKDMRDSFDATAFKLLQKLGFHMGELVVERRLRRHKQGK